MLTERDSISRRYFTRITLFTLTLQNSDIFQIQKGHPREGSECQARCVPPGTWPRGADPRPEGKTSPHRETLPTARRSWGQSGSAGAVVCVSTS